MTFIDILYLFLKPCPYASVEDDRFAEYDKYWVSTAFSLIDAVERAQV